MPQFRPNKTKRILKIMGEKKNKICQNYFRIKVTQRKLILADQKAEEDIKRRERERSQPLIVAASVICYSPYHNWATFE